MDAFSDNYKSFQLISIINSTTAENSFLSPISKTIRMASKTSIGLVQFSLVYQRETKTLHKMQMFVVSAIYFIVAH